MNPILSLRKLWLTMSLAVFGAFMVAGSAFAQTTAPTADSIKTAATGAIEDGAEVVSAILVAALAVVVVVALARKAPKIVKGLIGRL